MGKILSLIFVLISIIITQFPIALSVEDVITVTGYVYIDDIKTPPDQVILILNNKQFPALVFDDASFLVSIFGVPIGTIGTFSVIYNGDSYKPAETVTIIENQDVYNINLHIDTSGEPQPPPDDPTNIQPKAEANGPYYSTVNVSIDFDGTESYDSDGKIIKYEWDFGDRKTATGASPTHTYQELGKYTIKLTVTDNKGKSDLDITYAYITKKPNNPPSQPIINGITSGTSKSQYNYIILSTDKENDTIRYLIDWGDDTDPTASYFLQNGTSYSAYHSWKYPGIYILRAYAIDEEDVISKASEKIILIDTIYCEDIGYMTDYTDDSIYDLFYSNNTGKETPVEQINEIYLIDDNNDGEFEYQFNITTLEVNEYVQLDSDEQKTSGFIDLIAPLALYILISVIFVLILSIAYLTYRVTRKTKKKKLQIVEEKNKPIQKEIMKPKVTEKSSKTEDDETKKIENKIDELLAKEKS